MNTADYIIKKLEELGINDFFGLPGDYNFNILSAIENNSNTKWIGCTNELNAGYAADGYARLRGYGALVTTYGVGELSAVNAIAGSYAENVPVVHIVGIPSSKMIENKIPVHHNFQEADYRAFARIYDNVTSTTAYLTRDNAKLEIDRVLKTLVKEKKPVYIAIPTDIALMEISDRNTDLEWISDKDNLKEAAEKIAEKISDSNKPVIIGDVLIKRYDSRIEYREFVSKSGIPTTNFLMGMNLISNEYEQNLGTYCANYANPVAKKYIEEADCLIAVGTICSDINAFGLDLSAKINENIAIYGTYTYIDGKRYDNVKMSDILEQVTELIEPKCIKINKPETGYEHKYPENAPLTSEYIYSRIQDFIKENDIVFAETGTIPSGLSQMKLPNNVDINFQLLWGSIGWATAATFGATVAKPQSRIILITGEGAHQLTAMEIGSMLRLGLKPIIIVLNNSGYTTERFICNNKDADYNNIVNLNYAKFARVFDGDVWATKVETAEDFDKALKVTQIMNKMCYIELSLDKFDLAEITKKMFNSIRANVENEEIPTTIHNVKEIDIKELSLSSPRNFEFETVVHQGISDSSSEEDGEE